MNFKPYPYEISIQNFRSFYYHSHCNTDYLFNKFKEKRINVSEIVAKKIQTSNQGPIKNYNNEDCAYRDYDIRTEDNQIVRDAKKTFLDNTKISDQYFKDHFTFTCGSTINKMVFFTYSIGEYVARLSLYNIYQTGGGSANFIYGGLHEINSVISKEQAVNKLQTCIPDFKIDEIQLNKTGFYITAHNNSHHGMLNLETGECTKEFNKAE